MIATRLVLCAAMMAALPAASSAEVEFGSYEAAQTPYGRLEVRGANGARTLFLDGRPTALADYTYMSILGVYQVQGDAAFWVIVQPSYGGNMCLPPWVVLRLSPQGVAMTEPFGDCLGYPRDLRVTPGRLEIDLDDPELAVEYRTFAYDGARLTDTPVAAATGAAVAGAGADVLRWVGQHPAMPFEDAGERARFLRIMDAGQLENLRRHIGPATPAEQRGDWVLGAGCFPHQCNERTGGWGIRVSDGAVSAFMLNRDGAGEFFGIGNDPIFGAFLEEHRPR